MTDKINEQIIWLLWRGQNEDTHDLIGAFTTRELAQAKMAALLRGAYQEEYEAAIKDPWGDLRMPKPDELTVEEIDEYFERFGRDCWINDIILKGKLDADI